MILGGRKSIGLGFSRGVQESTPRLILEGVREHTRCLTLG